MGITPPRQQEIVHHYTETAGIVFTRQSPASVLHLEVFPSREKPEESGPPYTHRYEQPDREDEDETDRDDESR